MTDQQTPSPETSYVKPSMRHQCARHGCPMRGTIQTTHDAVCTFHYAVRHKDIHEVTKRITQKPFLLLYRVGTRYLTTVSNDPFIPQQQIDWLNSDEFSEFKPFRPPSWSNSHNKCGVQIIAMLTRYATHNLDKEENKPNHKRGEVSPEWLATVESVKAGIKHIPGVQDGIF